MMNVTTWSNGNPKQSGSGYGLRISKQDRDAHFNKAWTQIEIDIPGAGIVCARISKTFWSTCPELRNKHIGMWLIGNGLSTWVVGSPHIVKLTKIRKNRFKLSR